ncbi:DUF3761 domain-containing protein [Pseudonocardia benzenivorans]|uniref:DUF3761 domain-containing protein n=1 Tax=Pseudonocardia benzenivorans TaxID=228005 RepID=A0ABW3VCL5_9PSEU
MRRRPRSVLVASVLVVLGALFAVIPATAPLGLVLCLAASVPAVMAWRRTRGAPPNVRRPAVAAVALAPTFLVVAIVVVATTSSPARPAALLAEPGGTTRAAVPSLAPPPPSPTSLQQAPVSTSAASPTTVAPAPVTSRRAAAVAPRPTAAPPSVAARAAPACDTSTHYVNVSGNCVPRPGSSTTESPTAVCKDGEPSYSQHRSGTCSGHGGVATWLKNLPS